MIEFDPGRGIFHMIVDREVMTVANLLSRSAVIASVLSGVPALAGTPDEIRVPGEIPGTVLHYVFWRVE